MGDIRETSFLFRELDENELRLVVREKLGEGVKSYRLLDGGLFNTTYFIETNGSGKFVLRVGPVNRHLLMPFEHDMMADEVEVYKLLAENGVPCSKVVLCDTTKTLIDRDFMFVEYIQSTAMSNCALSPEDKARVFRDTGYYIAKMHAISSDSHRFGRIIDVKNGGGYAKNSDFMYAELLDWEKVGVPTELFTKEEHEKIRTLFKKSAPYLDEITVPALVHTDLWSGNILIRDENGIRDGRKEFAAIIDTDRSIWGDPLFEFSSIRWTWKEPEFWEGYGKKLPAGKDLPAGKSASVRCAVYTLLVTLFNAYVYLREYDDPESAERECTIARNNMRMLDELL